MFAANSFRKLTLVLLCAIVFPFAGCGGSGGGSGSTGSGSGGNSTGGSVALPVITTQPASQQAPIGSTIIFSVTATSSATLSYQWLLNGKTVTGATSATYTTPALQSSDAGDSYTVAVTNSGGTTNSTAASVSIGVRLPITGDLRFKGLATNPPGDTYTNAQQPVLTGLNGVFSETIENAFGSPLGIGPTQSLCVQNIQDDCSWSFSYSYLPTGFKGFNSTYVSDSLPNLDADLATLTGTNNVVHSLDEQSGNAIYAAALYTSSQYSGFTMQRAQVSQSSFATAANTLAASGAVITAVTINAAGQADYIAYTLKGDAYTYDATAVFSTPSSVEADAMNLAQQGYIITAVGEGNFTGFVLVGTKVHGDSAPRTLTVNTGSSTAVVVATLLTPGGKIALLEE